MFFLFPKNDYLMNGSPFQSILIFLWKMGMHPLIMIFFSFLENEDAIRKDI